MLFVQATNENKEEEKRNQCFVSIRSHNDILYCFKWYYEHFSNDILLLFKFFGINSRTIPLMFEKVCNLCNISISGYETCFVSKYLHVRRCSYWPAEMFNLITNICTPLAGSESYPTRPFLRPWSLSLQPINWSTKIEKCATIDET